MTELPPLIRDQRKADVDHLRLLSIFHFVGAGLAVLGLGFLAVHYLFFHAFLNNPEMWKNQKGAKIAHFRVKGVPGARGVTAHSGNVSTANAYWADGHCTFGSGDYVPEHAGPLSKPVISGIQSLYRRVKGACPS